MPNGTFHANTNLLVAAGATVASLSLSLAENNYSGFIGTIFFVLGVLSGIPLTPDLDLDENYWNSFYFLDIAHKFPGWIWHFFWYPYAKLMRHRSTLSHFPIFSTAIRCAYVLIPLTIAILLFDKEMVKKINTLRRMLSLLNKEERLTLMIDKLSKTKNNEEFLKSLNAAR